MGGGTAESECCIGLNRTPPHNGALVATNARNDFSAETNLVHAQESQDIPLDLS